MSEFSSAHLYKRHRSHETLNIVPFLSRRKTEQIDVERHGAISEFRNYLTHSRTAPDRIAVVPTDDGADPRPIPEIVITSPVSNEQTLAVPPRSDAADFHWVRRSRTEHVEQSDSETSEQREPCTKCEGRGSDITLPWGSTHHVCSILRVRPAQPFTFRNQMQRTFLNSWLSVLLPCVPVGIALHAVLGDSVATFAVNFIAIIPLSSMTEFALEEIYMRVGDLVGGLLCVTTSNFVQLISSVLLLRNGEPVVLQTSLVGGILANLLLTLGISILCGGYRREYQNFNLQVAHISANVLSLAATSLLIPTASRLLSQSNAEEVTKQSRGASFILMATYACFLVFQFKTHRKVFAEKAEKVPVIAGSPNPQDLGIGTYLAATGVHMASTGAATDSRGNIVYLSAAPELGRRFGWGEEEPEPTPLLHFAIAVIYFACSSALLAYCVDNTVNSVNALASGANLSKTFIGLVLLPIPNCDLAPISNAIGDNMNIVMTLTIGKCLQTALLVTPLSVLIGWGLDIDMTLVFSGFEVISLFAAILLLNFLLIEGRFSWIQGILLLGDWGLVAVAAFFTSQS